MRKFALVGAFGLGLAACLSACNPADISGNITSYEQDVEAGVKALCGVDPVATDILALFGLETVASAVSGICAAVPVATPLATRAGDGHRIPAPITYRRVTIHFQ